MSTLAILTVVFGAFIIAIRAPLIVAPEWTVQMYRGMLATTGRIRVLGVAMVLLSVGLVLSARGMDVPEARIIQLIGGFIAVVVFLLLLLAAGVYQRMALTMLDVMRSTLVLRCIGVIGTAFGVLMLYLARAVA